MRRILTSRIFLVVLTAIIVATGSVYATIRIQADEIEYQDGTVEDALNDLYGKTSEDIVDKLDLTTNFVYSYGYRTGPKSISINLADGDYLVAFASNYAWDSGSWTPSINGSIEEKQSGSNCKNLIQKKIVNYVSGNAAFTAMAIYLCKSEGNTTVTFSHQMVSAPQMSENYLLYSIKLQ